MCYFGGFELRFRIESHKRDPQILKYDTAGTTESLEKDEYSANAVEILSHPHGKK